MTNDTVIPIEIAHVVPFLKHEKQLSHCLEIRWQWFQHLNKISTTSNRDGIEIAGRSWLTNARSVLLNSLAANSQRINQRYHSRAVPIRSPVLSAPYSPPTKPHAGTMLPGRYYLNSLFRYRASTQQSNRLQRAKMDHPGPETKVAHRSQPNHEEALPRFEDTGYMRGKYVH